MKYRYFFPLAAATVCGILWACLYINTVFGEAISLGYLTAQLSGNRGEFLFSPDFGAVVELTLLLVPQFLFEAYAGAELYRHFCTASIYVFSRTTDRLGWYWKETLQLFLYTASYEVVFFLSAVLISCVRHRVNADTDGIITALCYVIFYSLWIYSMTMLINLLAVKWGSSMAFMAVCSVQLLLNAILPLIRNPAVWKLILYGNPVSRLIFGWYDAGMYRGDKQIGELIGSSGPLFSLESSFIIFICFTAAVLLLGAFYLKRHDLLLTDPEGEVL